MEGFIIFASVKVNRGGRGSPDFDLDPFLVVSFIGSSVDFLGLQSRKIQKKNRKIFTEANENSLFKIDFEEFI